MASDTGHRTQDWRTKMATIKLTSNLAVTTGKTVTVPCLNTGKTVTGTVVVAYTNASGYHFAQVMPDDVNHPVSPVRVYADTIAD